MIVRNSSTSLYLKLWILLAVVFTAGITTFIILTGKEKKYKSSAKLAIGIPEDQRKKGNEILFEIDLQNHIEAMKTEYVGTLVSYHLLLHDLHETPFRRNSFLLSPAERKKTLLTLKEKLNSFEPLSATDPFESKLQTVINQKGYDAGRWIKDGNLKVTRIDKSNIVRVEFLSENPNLSSYVVNKLCSEYSRYTGFWNEERGSAADSLSDLLAKQKQQLEAKANQLAVYKTKPTQVEDNDELTSQLAVYEQRLEDEKWKADKLAGALKALDSKIVQQPNTVSTEASSSTSAKVTQLQSKINDLNNAYIKGGSKDTELASVIGALKNQLRLELARLDQESSKSRTSANNQQLIIEKTKIESEQREADAQIQSIRASINKIKRTLSSSDFQEKNIQALEQDYNRSFQEYRRMQDDFEKAKVDNEPSETAVRIKLVSAGVPNSEPESNGVFLTTLIVMGIAALLTGIAMLAIAHFRAPNNNVESPLVIVR